MDWRMGIPLDEASMLRAKHLRRCATLSLYFFDSRGEHMYLSVSHPNLRNQLNTSGTRIPS